MLRLSRGLLLLCGALACNAPLLASAQESSGQLLQRMNDAFSSLSYDGVFSFLSGDELASLRVVHKVVDGVQRERLVHLNGAPREIVRHGEQVSCIVMPGDDLLALEKSIPSGPFARGFVRDFDRIASTYSVGQFGEGRVAGRMARRIAVTPKDQHRYGYRLWIDQDTALLLRSELVDHDGNKLEIFMFNQVHFGDEVTAAALEPATASGGMVSHLTLTPIEREPSDRESDPAAPASAAAGAWQTRWLPPGFKMASAKQRSKPDTAMSMNSLMYSDGLAAFSIYIEPLPARGAASMVSRNGATVAVTHTVVGGVEAGLGAETGAGEHYLVTLVGEIPVHTARQIVASVHRP